ncbi:MAG: Holliday junction resolvase RuvX [Bacteroidota bacterium]
MPRILAIDYGAKRTGLAVTDPLRIIASSLDVVASHNLENYLKDYFKKEEISKVVIGNPKNINGSNTNATRLVQAFIRRFKRVFPDKEFTLHDERFTSKMAMDAMIVGGMKKKNRRNKGNVDKISATIILQSYLESNS